jgi:hypothetical protein
MAEAGPTFIIKHEGVYYITQGLWVYDESQGTDEQKAGAKAVADFHAAARTTHAAVQVPAETSHADFGTAIFATAINGEK